MYAEAIAGITFAIVLYQDFKDRLVADWAWAPAAVAVPVMILESGHLWWLSLAKLGIMGLVGLVTWLLGAFGEADSVCFAAMGIGTSLLSPIPQLLGMSVAAIVHISYLGVRHGSLSIRQTMKVDDAINQNKWIPQEIISGEQRVDLANSPEKAWDALKEYQGKDASVVVSYGVPLAGYMAIGYLAMVVLLFLGVV